VCRRTLPLIQCEIAENCEPGFRQGYPKPLSSPCGMWPIRNVRGNVASVPGPPEEERVRWTILLASIFRYEPSSAGSIGSALVPCPRGRQLKTWVSSIGHHIEKTERPRRACLSRSASRERRPSGTPSCPPGKNPQAAMRMTFTALPIRSAGRRSPLGPVGIRILSPVP